MKEQFTHKARTQRGNIHLPKPPAWRWLAGFFLYATMACNAIGAQDSQPLIAVFPQYFPPIFNQTANGVPTGFGIEILEAVAERAGLAIEYRSVPSWPEAIRALKNGEADIIPNLGIVPARADDFAFTQPVEAFPVSIFVRAQSNDIRSVDDLLSGRYTVGVVHRNVGVSLMRQHAGVPTKVFDDMAAAFVELQTKSIDAVIYPRPVFEYFVNGLGLEKKVKIAGEPLVLVQRAIAVRKADTELLQRLNRALSELRSSSTYQVIHNRWHPSPAPDYNRLFKLFAGLVLAIGLAILLTRLILLNRLNGRLTALNAFNDAVLDATLEGIVTLDTDGIIRSANRATQIIFSIEDRSLQGMSLTRLLPNQEAQTLIDTMQTYASHRNGNYSWNGGGFHEAYGLRQNGELFPLRLGICPVQTQRQTTFVCTMHDLTEQRSAEQRLEYLADHDALTGLLNHRGVSLVMQSLLGQAERKNEALSCLCIGFSRLGHINEIYGRQGGDAALVQIAELLQKSIRGSDALGHEDNQLLARNGSDRFLLALPDTDVPGAVSLAQRLVHELEKFTVDFNGKHFHVETSVGISCYPDHGMDAESLINHAETTLFAVKKNTVESIRVFDYEVLEEESHLDRCMELIHRALKQDLFVLHFQPILHIPSKTIRHYETLVRIQEPGGNLIFPGDFIPAAERFGLINRIDYRVLQLTFARLAALEHVGYDYALAVNLSAAHIGDDNLFRFLESVFECDAVSPSNIIFEITETAALQNLSRAKSFMDPLKGLGCRFALDDFGVGFTSFAQLRTLPVDIVKIDGSFVRDLPSNPQDRALARAITEIAHSLNKKVVAEFVENEDILNVLQEIGVDYAQGYHIGKPLPKFSPTQPLRN